MKPVAIFRFAETEGPGYFATFLADHRIPWRLFAIDQSEGIPSVADEFSGLCLMGGPMSVNHPLPWIDKICTLIRDADAKCIPVIGHCLGGQLISKAFGGQVTDNPVKEIGWSHAMVENSAPARQWFGDQQDVTVFQWHGETFSIPENAHRLLTNSSCSNQMFALRNHLAMQCHIEMTETMIAEWSQPWPSEVKALNVLPASVQTPAQIWAESPRRLPTLRQIAHQIYSQWAKGMRR